MQGNIKHYDFWDNITCPYCSEPVSIDYYNYMENHHNDGDKATIQCIYCMGIYGIETNINVSFNVFEAKNIEEVDFLV